jgi:ubiquinone/menaquinone biosynthesis C-methylase UbiE
MSNGKTWFRAEKDLIRKRLFKYTRRAFEKIPRLEKPRILDAGCGSGVSAVELAKLADCKITCIDIDREMLELLRDKIRKEGLEDRIEAAELSILDMDFPENSFDIILAEGSVYAAGFGRALLDWKRFLKPGGFLVIHDSQSDIENKKIAVSACGYQMVNYFLLGSDIWRDEYFAPLENLVRQARQEFPFDAEARS